MYSCLEPLELTRYMEEGVLAAQDTAHSTLTVVEQADKMSDLVSNIADRTEKQADDAAEITLGIEQISGVVQTNAATAEKSAAVSEELSGQAGLLKNLVGKFRLKA